MSWWVCAPRRALIGVLTVGLLISSQRGLASARQPAPLELVTHFLTEFSAKNDKELKVHHDALLARLLLDGGRVNIERPQDIHDVIVLTAISERLITSDTEPDAKPDTLAIAYLMDAAGDIIRERPGVLNGVSVPATDKGGDVQQLMLLLKRDAHRLKALGGAQFLKALRTKRSGSGELSARDHHLHARYLIRGSQMRQALRALKRAEASRPTPLVLLDQVTVMTSLGNAKGAGRLAKALMTQIPALRGALQERVSADGAPNGAPGVEVKEGRSTTDLGLDEADRTHLNALLTRDAQDELNQAVISIASRDGVTPHVLLSLGRHLLKHDALEAILSLIDTLADVASMQRTRDELLLVTVLRARLEGRSGGDIWSERDLTTPIERLMTSTDATDTGRGLTLATLDAFSRRDTARLKQLDARLRQREALSLREVMLMSATWLNLGAHHEAFALLAGTRAKLNPQDQATIGLIACALRLTLGVRRGDRDMVERCLSELKALIKRAPKDFEARLTYLRILGQWSASQMGIKRFNEEDIIDDQAAYRQLITLVDQVDPRQPNGALMASGVATSAGALALSLGQRTNAVNAFRVARRLSEDDVVDGLLDGWIALVMGDPSGALLRFEAASRLSATPQGRCMALKWAALGANRAGDAVAVTALFARLVDLWDLGRLPPIKQDGTPTLHGFGEIQLMTRLSAQGAAEVEAKVTLIPMLLADFPHDRAQIEALVRGGRR